MKEDTERKCVICKKPFFRAAPRHNKNQRRRLGNNIRPGHAVTCSRLCAKILCKTRNHHGKK